MSIADLHCTSVVTVGVISSPYFWIWTFLTFSFMCFCILPALLYRSYKRCLSFYFMNYLFCPYKRHVHDKFVSINLITCGSRAGAAPKMIGSNSIRVVGGLVSPQEKF